jgi:hypothetical protein
MAQKESPSLSSLVAHIVVAWSVIVVAWWFLYPHPRANNDLAVFAVCAVSSSIAAVLASRRK